jgi:hypothetical protein
VRLVSLESKDDVEGKLPSDILDVCTGIVKTRSNKKTDCGVQP